MNLIDLGKFLSDVLPKLRNRIQLSGLIIVVVLAALVTLVKPGDSISLVLAGGIGVGFIVFAQLFQFLSAFSENSRPTTFLTAFLAFLVFVVVLLGMLILRVQSAEVSVDVTPVQKGSAPMLPSGRTNSSQSDWVDRSVDAKTVLAVWNIADASSVRTTLVSQIPTLGQTINLPPPKFADEVTYSFSRPGGVSTLTANFPYIDLSRSDQYPDADWHQGVNFGQPNVWFTITNPTAEVRTFSQIQFALKALQPIEEVILDSPEIDGYVSGKSQNLRLINRGWGQAKDAVLTLWVGNLTQPNTYSIIAQKTYKVGILDEEFLVDIGDLIPSNAVWDDPEDTSGSSCSATGKLKLIGRLDYFKADGRPQHETFRQTIYQCFGGGGNIPWSAYYNVNLPFMTNKFPVFVSLDDCIAAHSAGKFMMIFSAERSGRYRLEYTLSDTSGQTIVKELAVDIVVPRSWNRTSPPTGKFVENINDKGCT